ncbi:MAG: hypothetical protein V4608_03515 [Bacteroidota bacterium]
MNRKAGLIILLWFTTLLTGCTTTFAGSVFVVRFGDIVFYVAIAFMFAVLIALVSRQEKRRHTFWLWLFLNLLLTPLPGFIYLLIKITKKNPPSV